MYHSRALRGVGIVLASAYLLGLAVAVATGHKPVCRLRDAVGAQSAAERFRAHHDYSSAERMNGTAVRFVLGCATMTSARVGFVSAERAATAYGQEQYSHALALLDAGRSGFYRATTLETLWQRAAASIAPVVTSLKDR